MNDFEKAYKLLEENVKCPLECSLCEGPEAVIFLPGEFEYLMKKYHIPKNLKSKFIKYDYKGKKVYALLKDDPDCPFLKFGRCERYRIRPLDCRIFPAVPIFEKDKIRFSFSRTCPLNRKKKIPKNFLENVRQAFILLNPPVWWKEFYNKKVQ